MTDPIERVARAMLEFRGIDPDKAHPMDPFTAMHECSRDEAACAIKAYKAWLTEQGLPSDVLDKLLSGEMRAVENKTGLVGKERPGPGWKVSPETAREIEELEQRQRTAQLDHAGNPPVTPEGCQEPTGATHSEKQETEAEWLARTDQQA